MKPRLYVAAILGGLGVLIVVAVVAFAIGRSNPSPPSLQDNPRPEIPGEILYVNSDACFVRAAASGETRATLACVPQLVGGSQLFWPEPGLAGFLRPTSTGTATLWTVDLETGETVDTGQAVVPDGSGRPVGIFGGVYAPDGTFASVSQDGTLTLLKDGARTSVTKFDSPKYSQPQVVLWSPDSQWMLLRYYPRGANGPELWVVSRDASVQGTLLTDTSYSEFAWRIGDEVEPNLPDK